MIREMRREDLPFVKSLMQSVPCFWHDCWTDNTLEKAFNFSGNSSFVYEQENKIIGCIFAYDFGFRGYIAGLVVSEEMRNKGIGKNLVEHVKNMLEENGCELIIADVLKSSESFYKKLGWRNPKSILLCKRLME